MSDSDDGAVSGESTVSEQWREQQYLVSILNLKKKVS